MKTDKIILYATALIVIVLAVYTIRCTVSEKKIVFVDIGKMLDNYQFKKDMETRSNADLNRIKLVVDSLRTIQRVASSSAIDSQIVHAEDAFEQYYSMASQDLGKKVWERLNPLLEQYGKEKGYQLMVGANGAGTVLYGSDRLNITDDLIKYINEKYAKGN